MPSRFELSVHPFVVGASTDEIVVGGAAANPMQSYGQNARPTVRGARWVEAARTELGLLATMGLEALGRPAGFADSSLASAETAFLLAIDPSEGETVRPDEATPMLLVVPPSFARPARRDDTPAPRNAMVTPEAARAFLAQPTALFAPSNDPEALQRITIGPAAPRASAPPPPRPRTRSFVGKLGVSVCPPPRASVAPPAHSPSPRASFAPLAASTNRMVVVHQSRRARAWNMAAAVLSGLAAAMVVMAVVVSV